MFKVGAEEKKSEIADAGKCEPDGSGISGCKAECHAVQVSLGPSGDHTGIILEVDRING